MQKKRLLVISVDALFAEDKKYFESSPNIGPWLEHASGCVNTKSIYPTVTYPNHVAMNTGCYPEKNGVYTNYHFTTTGQSNKHWMWEADEIKVDTIFHAAKKAGYSTANGFWPVTCYMQDGIIDYHVPEYWLVHEGETVEGAFAERGTSPEVLEIVKANKKYLRPGVETFIDKEPEYDDFIVHCDCDIIRKFKPELMLTHWCVVDACRHYAGIYHPMVNEAFDYVDRFFGMIQSALKDAGVYDETDIFIVSDHGQMDIERKIRLNAFFVDRGFIKLDAEGQVEDYTAMMISDGMSAEIYLKDPNDHEAWQKTYDMLKEMAEVGIYGFTEVFTREEVREKYHTDGPFSFMIETDGYTSFMDGFKPPYVQHEDMTDDWDHRLGKATHGFLPWKGPKPMLWCKGPHIRPDVWLPEHEVIDEAPTYAKLLGAELPEAQGKPMLELLR